MLLNQKNARQRIHKFVVLFLTSLCSLNFGGCEPRERTNIFDPLAKIDSLDLGLTITSADSIIGLRWSAPYIVQYDGFHLYRRMGNEKDYKKIASLPAWQKFYRDSIPTYDILYRYYVIVQGQSGTSPPSHSAQVTPGPVSFWVLDSWLYLTMHLTYDLNHTIVTRYGVWEPQDLALDKKNDRALITYPLFHYFEIIDMRDGSGLAYNYELDYPFVSLFIPQVDEFWLADTSSGLYKVDPLTGKSILFFSETVTPLQMVSDARFVYVLDTGLRNILTFDLDGNLNRTVDMLDTVVLQNPQFIEKTTRDGNLFIIDLNKTEEILYRYNVNDDSVRLIFKGQGLKTVRVESQGRYLWVSVNNEQGGELLQLSPEGLRLKTLNGFKYIADFRINKYNGGLLVADPGQKELIHIREDGTLIGKYSETIFPLKVYTQ
ncbi:MAG TPA: hypothetical protein EYP36_10110 [Calditrichaeota bacterium]|nr:hypothetical protein [Calditrichota bacterium]